MGINKSIEIKFSMGKDSYTKYYLASNLPFYTLIAMTTFLYSVYCTTFILPLLMDSPNYEEYIDK